MRILICTQAVDAKDPVLGFFVRWIEEFAAHCEEVTVVCLREGAHTLPANVSVHSAGKESGAPKLVRWWKVLRYVIALRRRYEAVFVHMNPEYLVALGWLWRLMGKKTALWYTHKHVDLKLYMAARMAHVIFTASAESFRLRSNRLRIVGHGIDTDFFSPAENQRGGEILSVGRLSATKRHDLAIRSLQYIHRELFVAGEGEERGALEELAQKLQVGARTHFLGARSQTELRDLYRRAGVLAHTSETGSMDKVVLEALMCGLPVVSTSEAFKTLLEPSGFWVEPEAKALASALERAIGADISALSVRVRTEHSLRERIPAILKALA